MMTFGDRPNSVMAHWIGGACEASPRIDVTPDGGVTIRVTTGRKAEPCDGVAVPRYVMIEFSAPPDMSRTSIAFEP